MRSYLVSLHRYRKSRIKCAPEYNAQHWHITQNILESITYPRDVGVCFVYKGRTVFVQTLRLLVYTEIVLCKQNKRQRLVKQIQSMLKWLYSLQRRWKASNILVRLPYITFLYLSQFSRYHEVRQHQKPSKFNRTRAFYTDITLKNKIKLTPSTEIFSMFGRFELWTMGISPT